VDPSVQAQVGTSAPVADFHAMVRAGRGDEAVSGMQAAIQLLVENALSEKCGCAHSHMAPTTSIALLCFQSHCGTSHQTSLQQHGMSSGWSCSLGSDRWQTPMHGTPTAAA